MSINWKRVLALGVIAALTLSSYAEEAAPLTEERLKQLVKELGDEDFAKRQNAEKELTRAGAKAEIVLKAAQASTDPQVKATAARLLGRLRLSTIGAIDYLEVMPASSIVAIQLKNLGTSLENAKKTAIGQIVLSKDLEPFRTQLDALLNQQPDKKKEALTWVERFKGQFAFAIWELQLMPPPEEVKLGALIEITDPNPRDVLDELIKKTGIFADGQKTTNHKDVEILHHPLGMGPSVALLGRHLIVANNIESVQKLVDGFLAPGGIAGSADFKKARPSLNANPEFVFAMDFQKYMKFAQSMTPLPGYDEMMKAAGVTAKYMVMSSAVSGDSFEDRFVMVNSGPPAGLAAAGIPPADAPPPLADVSLIPSNAVAAMVTYVDGAKLGPAFVEYMAGLKKIMDGLKNQVPPPPVAPPDFTAVIKTFEEKSGLKLTEILALVKGSVGYYVVLAPGGAVAPPDIGMFLTCPDAEKAKAVNAAIAKGFSAYDNKNAIREIDTPARKIYQLDLAALGLPIQPNFPYAPCWAIEGNHVFIASSIQALRKQLTYIDNKTPGLLTQPDFVKALGNIGAEERKGQIVYIDVKSLASFGATVGLPLLQTKIQDPVLKKNLATLPPPAQLFKDLPPLLTGAVTKGDLNVGVLRSPIPPFQSIFLLAFGAGLAMPMMGGMPAPPAQVPPGGF
ncbi:MAG TPA: hypothetical protein VEK08_04535 [Planctomycetota bacterium]|nr:hypothetical protein [Planctomycetota bacterium]